MSTPRDPPDPVEVQQQCYAEYQKAGNSDARIHLKIGSAYPHHRARICRPSSPGVRSDDVHHEAIDFSKAGGDIISLAGFSIYGNGDETKCLEMEWKAGFAFLSVQPATHPQIVHDYSPIRESSGLHDWWGKIAEVGEVTRAMGPIKKRGIPEDEHVGFPFVGRSSRYWAACKSGISEVEVGLVGSMPTHPPSETPLSTKQCELGQYGEVIEYEDRPVVALDGGDQGFSSDTKYLIVRAVETDPTPLIQATVDISMLRLYGQVTLVHDALDPNNVIRIWGNKPEEIEHAQANSMFTVTLKIDQGP